MSEEGNQQIQKPRVDVPPTYNVKSLEQSKPVPSEPENFSHNARFKQELFVRNIYFKHMRSSKDCFVILEADKGYGKSTLAIILANRWISLMRRKMDYPMKLNLKRHVIYDDDVENILQKVRDLPVYSPLIFDEGGRIVLGEDWNRRENKKIKKLFSEIRTKHLLVMVNSPFALDQVDKKYTTNFLDFWIHLWGTGFATVFMKNRHPMKKGFQFEQLNNLLPEHVPEVGNMRELFNVNNKIMGHPCYYDTMLWQPLTQSVYDEYQKLRDEAVYDNQQESQVEEEMSVSYKVRRDKYVLIKQLNKMDLKDNDIARILNLSNASVSVFKKRMAKDVIAREGEDVKV